MKSRKTLPTKKRLKNGEYNIGFGKMAYYGLVKMLEKYHRALEAAENEIKQLKIKVNGRKDSNT